MNAQVRSLATLTLVLSAATIAGIAGSGQGAAGRRGNRGGTPDPAFKWTDSGKVVTSHTNDDFNAIDPAAFLDTDGRLYMAFGSFWSGIQLLELDPNTGLRLPNTPMTNIAHWDAIEGAYIYKH